MDPLVTLEDHKPSGCEAEKGRGACEILQTHKTHTHSEEEVGYVIKQVE